MSDTQQSRATLSHNFVAQQSCLGNSQFYINKQSPNKHGFQWHRRRLNYH